MIHSLPFRTVSIFKWFVPLHYNYYEFPFSDLCFYHLQILFIQNSFKILTVLSLTSMLALIFINKFLKCKLIVGSKLISRWPRLKFPNQHIGACRGSPCIKRYQNINLLQTLGQPGVPSGDPRLVFSGCRTLVYFAPEKK